MTVSEMTAIMSAVGKRRPELVQDRKVALFIQLCIDEARAPDAAFGAGAAYLLKKAD